jgi:putative DNA primase/helicase
VSDLDMALEAGETNVAEADFAAVTDAVTGFVTDNPSENTNENSVVTPVTGVTGSAEKDTALEGNALVDELVRLAQLGLIEYEQARTNAAHRCGMRRMKLDSEVEKVRKRLRPEVAPSLDTPVRDPWPDPVDGAALLDELTATYSRHLVLPEGGAETCALWVLYSHTFDAFDIAPRLLFSAPTNNCGKSQGLALTMEACQRPIACSSATPAAIYRAVELGGRTPPTLFLDEADRFLRNSPQHAEIFNSAHMRHIAYVLRCDGDEMTPKRFSTWAPAAYAWNEEHGRLQATAYTRCLDIRMRRKGRGEQVKRVVESDREEMRILGRKCARWAKDHFDALRLADPSIPDALNNRGGDNWRPLFAVADEAGKGWPATARRVAQILTKMRHDDDQIGVELLRDVKEVLSKIPDQFITTETLVGRRDDAGGIQLGALNRVAEQRWATYDKRGPMTGYQLAGLLKMFNIVPEQRRMPRQSNPVRGYDRAALEAAFEIYLPAIRADNPVTAVTPVTNEQNQ